MALLRSWLDSANTPDTQFPLNNLPYGVFSVGDGALHCGVAIGDRILDVTGLEGAGVLRADPQADVLDTPSWNDFMELGPEAWARYRKALTALLSEGAEEAVQDICITFSVPMSEAQLHLPFRVSEFTDFYASRHHATNVGTMFRGAQNALPPNWLHMPIGYNGRASSVVVSGTDVRRPHGQLKAPHEAMPRWAPTEKMDFELELGAIVGVPSDGPLTAAEAGAHLFGYVLLNDWSARDIQAWEYQPLGPFQSKASATTISAWIVPGAALEPFRRAALPAELPLLPHLQEEGPGLFDIDLTVTLTPEGGAPEVICHTNYGEMYYSPAQQLAHHSSAGCPMRVGDLLGSGTVSGPTRNARGALLEISWNGEEPLELQDGSTRSFLADGDIVTLTGRAQGEGFQIGFGDCSGRLVAANQSQEPA